MGLRSIDCQDNAFRFDHMNRMTHITALHALGRIGTLQVQGAPVTPRILSSYYTLRCFSGCPNTIFRPGIRWWRHGGGDYDRL